MFHRSKAFTLVELLVVIAIISVLAGMLMPVMEEAVDSSKGIACLNNLKQMGIGVSMYTQDYDGVFFTHWDGKVTWYGNKGSTYNYSFNCLYLDADETAPGNLLDCPAGTEGWSHASGFFIDYGYNFILNNRRSVNGNPVIFCDAERYLLSRSDWGWSWDDLSPAIGGQWCHRNGANFLFYDNHCKWLAYEVITDDVFYDFP